MRHRLSIAIVILAATVTGARSQHAPAPPPYAGLQGRSVKALSDAQIADLKAGRGMGLALPAELNGYPGPMHVLELAAELGLSEAQGERMRRLVSEMKAEAMSLGERIVARETDLDRLFAGRAITPASLQEATEAIAGLQGALRFAHLRFHLATVEVLTPDQRQRYGELRGYGGSEGHGQGAKRPH